MIEFLRAGSVLSGYRSSITSHKTAEDTRCAVDDLDQICPRCFRVLVISKHVIELLVTLLGKEMGASAYRGLGRQQCVLGDLLPALHFPVRQGRLVARAMPREGAVQEREVKRVSTRRLIVSLRWAKKHDQIRLQEFRCALVSTAHDQKPAAYFRSIPIRS